MVFNETVQIINSYIDNIETAEKIADELMHLYRENKYLSEEQEIEWDDGSLPCGCCSCCGCICDDDGYDGI